MNIGIVEELQRAASDQSVTIAELLRKALVVSSKLELDDTSGWITKELDGYEVNDTVPEYRVVKGRLHAFNSAHGWQPVNMAGDLAAADLIETKKFYSRIAAIQDMLLGNEGHTVLFPPDHAVQGELCRNLRVNTKFTVIVAKGNLTACIDALRTAVLKWALKLERSGIHGENHSFSATEKAKAENASVSGLTFHAPVQTVLIQQHTQDSAQSFTTTTTASEPKKGSTLLALVAKLWESVPQTVRWGLLCTIGSGAIAVAHYAGFTKVLTLPWGK